MLNWLIQPGTPIRWFLKHKFTRKRNGGEDHGNDILETGILKESWLVIVDQRKLNSELADKKKIWAELSMSSGFDGTMTLEVNSMRVVKDKIHWTYTKKTVRSWDSGPLPQFKWLPFASPRSWMKTGDLFSGYYNRGSLAWGTWGYWIL